MVTGPGADLSDSEHRRHAPPVVWFRDKFRVLDRTLSSFTFVEVGFVLATFTPGFEALIENADKSVLSRQDWTDILGKFAISLPPALALIFAKRNADNYLSGLQRGAFHISSDWQMATRGLIAGLSDLSEMLGQTQARRAAPAKAAVYQFMVSVRKTVAGVFDGVNENDLTVTLGVTRGSGRFMTIVELTPETPERRKGNTYPVPAQAEDCHSMIQAKRTRKPNYTPDAHVHPDLEGKPYRSILSFPLLASDRSVIAVLNIDGPMVDMFSRTTRHTDANGDDHAARKIVHQLCQPALKAMALTIELAKLYKEGARS